MRVLGIETSCDETGVALYDTRRGLLAEALHSQVAVHRAYGGVVPEVASRRHLELVLPVIREALGDAGATLDDLTHVAVTPGAAAGQAGKVTSLSRTSGTPPQTRFRRASARAFARAAD